MSERREIGVECVVTIEVADNAPADWLTRVTVPGEFPYWNRDGSPFTEEQGIAHLVHNAVANGVEDASRLDGWGDLDAGMLWMSVGYVEVAS